MEFREEMAEGKSGVEQQSIMDQLRKAREEVLAADTLDLDVPHYRGKLVARYRVLSNEEIEKMSKRVRRQFRGDKEQAHMVLAMAQDGLIESCTGLYFRDDNGDLQQLTADGAPMVYDVNLANFLQLGELDSARQVVLEVFGGPDKDMSLVDHYIRVVKWMRDTGADVTGDLLGEF
jgi:hypothetical protein